MLAKHPDPTVDHVLKTWAPRMIVQGIEFNDLRTTAVRIREQRVMGTLIAALLIDSKNFLAVSLPSCYNPSSR